jgi:uncharacterized protein YpmB
VQLITFVDSTASAVTITLLDYLTPYSTTYYSADLFTASSSDSAVQTAIQALTNVDSVDVSTYTDTSGYTVFAVTFLTNLGIVPLLISSDTSKVTVSEATQGVSEVQMITLASDIEYVREQQQFELATSAAAVYLSYNGGTAVAVTSPTTALIQAALETFNGADGSPLSVTVTEGIDASTMYTVTFTSPVGDAALLVVTSPDSTTAITVVETIKGVAPSTGTFTLYYEGQYTVDIAYDASALEVKTAVESLSNLGSVEVVRADTGNGFSWSVGFAQNGGDLRLMQASPYRYEVQQIITTGGSPTPLSGQFGVSFGGDSVIVNYDASASSFQSSLESMASVGDVEVSFAASSNGQATWLVTFRSLVGDVDTLSVDNSLLYGSNANVVATESIAGNSATLNGSNPRLTVEEKVAGYPSYLASFTVDLPGSFLTKVSQLESGGLYAQYFDNQYLYGSPTVERIDPTVQFDWSTGLVTPDSSEYVSVRWTGKLLVPKTESYTFYLIADDAANLAINHTLVINASDVCCIEHRAVVSLIEGEYIDLSLEYQQLTGAASVSLQWSSASVRKQIIPSTYLFYATDIVGSPFSTTIVPGAADYPYTDAFGDGLLNATAGSIATFYIQTKDAFGNNKTTEYELIDPNDLLSVTLTQTEGAGYYASLEYVGPGLFKASYLPLKSGSYDLSIKMGGYDIYCGLGGTLKCSPFALTVSPGSTVPTMSEAESPSDESSDYLVEAVAGQFGYFYIQARDAFGNNQNKGGDAFLVKFTSKTDSDYQYQATVDDHGDGTYTARYTIPIAFSYNVYITLKSSEGWEESLLSCVSATTPFIFSRYYDGITAYSSPSFCALDQATSLKVVHNDLDPHSCTYDETDALSLSVATVGIANFFFVESRDAFGNLRRGENTTDFTGYGDGTSDYFLAEFEQAETGDKVTVSSAIDYIVAANIDNTTTNQYFRLSFGGRTTDDIISGVSAGGLEAILESLFDYQLNVMVTKTFLVKSTVTFTWAVQFLNMLDVWQSAPDFGSVTSSRLTLVAPFSSTESTSFYSSMTISREMTHGIYPISFSLWHTGSYTVRITNKGVDVQGSPLTIVVSNGDLSADASVAYGTGLEGGVAGEPVIVNIQAKDTRQAAVQYLKSTATIINYVQEIQQVVVNTACSFVFRGQTSVALATTDTYATLVTLLDNMVVLGTYEILDTSGVAVTTTDTVGTFQIKFTSLPGTLPLMSSIDASSTTAGLTVTRVQTGDAPYRHEVQVITCSALVGYVTFTLNGITTGENKDKLKDLNRSLN